MKFVDQVSIKVSAGKGGDGCRSFLRLKYKPKCGPDGGDGGDGGSIYFEGDSSIQTLYDLKLKHHLKAKNGEPGRGKDQYGKKGPDLIQKLPLGTILYDEEENIFGELLEHGDQICVAKGGKGGRGNRHFKSSTNQAPERFEKGWPGDERSLFIELKLIADVGLVGFPNAGKSTFISKVSRAKPKIASYPFTTLTPNLGVVEMKNFNRFAIADIPGLIEGASDGAGLGFQFLRHIGRCQVLLFCIDLEQDWLESLDDIEEKLLEKYRKLKTELGNFDAELLSKRSFIIITKVDMLYSLEDYNSIKDRLQSLDFDEKVKSEQILVSSETGENLQDVLVQLQSLLY